MKQRQAAPGRTRVRHGAPRHPLECCEKHLQDGVPGHTRAFRSTGHSQVVVMEISGGGAGRKTRFDIPLARTRSSCCRVARSSLGSPGEDTCTYSSSEPNPSPSFSCRGELQKLPSFPPHPSHRLRVNGTSWGTRRSLRRAPAQPAQPAQLAQPASSQ